MKDASFTPSSSTSQGSTANLVVARKRTKAGAPGAAFEAWAVILS